MNMSIWRSHCTQNRCSLVHKRSERRFPVTANQTEHHGSSITLWVTLWQRSFWSNTCRKAFHEIHFVITARETLPAHSCEHPSVCQSRACVRPCVHAVSWILFISIYNFSVNVTVQRSTQTAVDFSHDAKTSMWQTTPSVLCESAHQHEWGCKAGCESDFFIWNRGVH